MSSNIDGGMDMITNPIATH